MRKSRNTSDACIKEVCRFYNKEKYNGVFKLAHLKLYTHPTSTVIIPPYTMLTSLSRPTPYSRDPCLQQPRHHNPILRLHLRQQRLLSRQSHPNFRHHLHLAPPSFPTTTPVSIAVLKAGGSGGQVWRLCRRGQPRVKGSKVEGCSGRGMLE